LVTPLEIVRIVAFWLSILVQGGSNSFNGLQQHRHRHRHRQAADLLQHCAAARSVISAQTREMGMLALLRHVDFLLRKDAVHTAHRVRIDLSSPPHCSTNGQRLETGPFVTTWNA
jgi:hypothetical protein